MKRFPRILIFQRIGTLLYADILQPTDIGDCIG